MVRAAGLEPAHRMATEPKSVESTNSTTPAYLLFTGRKRIATTSLRTGLAMTSGETLTEGTAPKSVESTNSIMPAGVGIISRRVVFVN